MSQNPMEPFYNECKNFQQNTEFAIIYTIVFDMKPHNLCEMGTWWWKLEQTLTENVDGIVQQAGYLEIDYKILDVFHVNMILVRKMEYL